MKFGRVPALSGLFALITTLVLAACGGGGGGGSAVPAPTATPIPTAAPTAAISGELRNPTTAVSFANAQVLFSCGCTEQAGTVQADANGNFSILGTSTAVPASPSPTYTTVPGRNYLIVGANSNGSQVWTMGFLGSTPSKTLNLSGTTATNVTDTFTAATALYVFYESSQFSGDQTFDHWNFNTLAAFTQSLRSSNGNNHAEQQFVQDIAAAQAANQSLFPGKPLWDPKPTETPNATIAADIRNVASSGDTALPTPCPSAGCVGGPTP